MMAMYFLWLVPLFWQSLLAQECSDFAPPLTIKGKKFFNSLSGEYVPLKGIAYYPRPNAGNLTLTNSIDFFTEEFRSLWEADIANFVDLGVNVVRIYAVNPALNHDAFFCSCKAANIWVMVGLGADCQDCAITRQTAPNCYPAALKTRGEFIIHEFSRYENILGFDAGNEVTLYGPSLQDTMPCQKKFLRDMREYVDSCESIRKVPVGVVIVDRNLRIQNTYYGCYTDPDDTYETAEYIGINTYRHCDGTATSIDDLVGYQDLLQSYRSMSLPMPVMVAECGCVNPSFPTIDGYEAQRDFLQIEAFFTPDYRAEFAGATVFEYSTEDRQTETPYPYSTYGRGNFGIGYYSPENCNHQNVSCEYIRYPQFETLAQKFAAVDVSDEPSIDEYVAPTSIPTCPDEIPPLSNFTWASDSVDSFKCPNRVAVFCPGVPGTCTTFPPSPNPSQAPTVTPMPTAGMDPPSAAPTKLLLPTSSPTLVPSSIGLEPTAAPTVAKEDPSPTGNPALQSSPTPRPTVRSNLPTISPTRVDLQPSSAMVSTYVLCPGATTLFLLALFL